MADTNSLEDMQKHVADLVKRASAHAVSSDSMRFAQAALNAAQAVSILAHARREGAL